jgi:hypothetical protein
LGTDGCLFLKDWITAQTTPVGRDDKVYSLVWFVSGKPFHHSAFKYQRFLSPPICVNYLSTFKYPVISVLYINLSTDLVINHSLVPHKFFYPF